MDGWTNEEAQVFTVIWLEEQNRFKEMTRIQWHDKKKKTHYKAATISEKFEIFCDVIPLWYKAKNEFI